MFKNKRQTPSPNQELKPVFVLIVGHTRLAPGATFALGESEYQYNKKVAEIAQRYARGFHPNIQLEIIYRDGIGISGAYKKAAKLKPDACIELHFNAFNKKATGTETLCSSNRDDKEFAALVQAMMCRVFERGGNSRGVKVIPRSANGGTAVHSLPGSANCLVEPFFGDVMSEAQLAVREQDTYARGLVDSMAAWAKVVGLIAA